MEPPLIQISAPEEGNSFNALAHIPVKAAISDDIQLQSVSLQLLEQGLKPVLPAFTYTPEEKTFDLSKNYPLDDIHLETGEYFLRIKAADGENESSSYVQVYISGVPIERKGIVVISEAGSAVEVSILDTAYEASTLATVSGPFNGSGVSSYYQYINVANQQIRSYRVEDGAMQWHRSDLLPVISMSFYQEISYACFDDSVMVGYNQRGNEVFYASSSWGPKRIFRHEDIIIADEKEMQSTQKRLAFYHSASGALRGGVIQTNCEAVDFFSVNEDGGLLLANCNGTPFLYHLDMPDAEAATLTELRTLSSGKISAAAQVNSDIVLFAHTDGLYRYQFSLNSLTLMNTAGGVEALLYDPFTEELFAASGDQIFIYDYSPGAVTLKATLGHSAPVRAMHVLYNK